MSNSAEIEPAIDAFATEPDGGIIVVPPVAILPSATQWINRLALKHWAVIRNPAHFRTHAVHKYRSSPS